jgi:hypothetical protein
MAVFISYSSKDQHSAEAICNAIENRGFPCWISSRDIGPGQNFQSSIVQAIRGAKVMILVFSGNANNSEEIKKELVLAGQSRLVVIPVRVEDVAPGDAFAYEFATRQWIDVFQNWEHAIERVTQQIQAVIATEPTPVAPAAPRVTETVSIPPLQPAVAAAPQRSGNSTAIWAGAAVAAVVALGVIGWLVFGAQHTAPPSAAPASAPSAAAPVPPASSPTPAASSATAAPVPPSSPATSSLPATAAGAVSPTPTSAPTAAAAQVSPAPAPPAAPASPPASSSSSSGPLSPFNAINQGVDAIKKQP